MKNENDRDNLILSEIMGGKYNVVEGILCYKTNNGEEGDFQTLHDNIGDENNLGTYIDHLTKLLNWASKIHQANKGFEDDILDKSQRIGYLEYTIKHVEDENNKLKDSIIAKDSKIDELSLRLSKAEKKNSILNNAKLVIDQELKSLIKENDYLKAYKEEEENKKRNQLNYKIKSAISNMKIF